MRVCQDDQIPGTSLNGVDTTSTRSQRKARMQIIQSTANASSSQATANISDDTFIDRSCTHLPPIYGAFILSLSSPCICIYKLFSMFKVFNARASRSF